MLLSLTADRKLKVTRVTPGDSPALHRTLRG